MVSSLSFSTQGGDFLFRSTLSSSMGFRSALGAGDSIMANDGVGIGVIGIGAGGGYEVYCRVCGGYKCLIIS